jgi:hypothetical protein
MTLANMYEQGVREQPLTALRVKSMTLAETRRIAINIARLPELLRREH